MERLRPWLVWWATIMVTGYFSFLYLHGWKAIGALAGVAVGLIGFILVLRDLLRRRPQLKFVGFECGPSWTEGKAGYIAYIKVANDPTVGMEPIYAIAVTLKYLNEETGAVVQDRVIGRWSHLARVTDSVEASAHRRVVIEGDGHPYRVEVAMSLAGSPEMFVIDNQQVYKGLDRSLGAGPKIVEVRLQEGLRGGISMCHVATV